MVEFNRADKGRATYKGNTNHAEFVRFGNVELNDHAIEGFE